MEHTYTILFLLGEDLWGIVGGGKVTIPDDLEELKKWKIGVGRAMYVLAKPSRVSCYTASRMRRHPWRCGTPLQLCSLRRTMLYFIFSRMSFTKDKTLCEQIAKLDPENPITKTRIRIIIVRGLKFGYSTRQSEVGLHNHL